jgi:RecJ-like exonuclease
MTGRVALGHMLVEQGKIVAIRHVASKNRIEFGDDVEVANTLMASPQIYDLEGYELGWGCPKCQGDGLVHVTCNCGACGGFDERPCPDCSAGVKWEDEY